MRLSKTAERNDADQPASGCAVEGLGEYEWGDATLRFACSPAKDPTLEKSASRAKRRAVITDLPQTESERTERKTNDNRASTFGESFFCESALTCNWFQIKTTRL